MAFITCNGTTVLRAEISMPSVGRWYAELALVGDEAITGSVSLSAEGMTLSGTVSRGALFHRRMGLQLVGGSGGLVQNVPPKFYRKAPARIIAADILSSVGEKLSPTSDAGLLGTELPVFVRSASPASVALQLVVEDIGAGWRVLDDGSVWIGRPAWAASTSVVRVLSADEALGAYVLGVDDLSLRPGTTIQVADRTVKVGQVIYHVEPERIRAEVYNE